VNKLYAWFRIVRPPIVFIGTFGSIATGLIFSGTPGSLDISGGWPMWSFIVTMFCWGTIWGGIMVHNDYFDLKSDNRNRPEKPLSCGAIAPRTALWAGAAMMVVPLPVILLVNWPNGSWVAISATFWAFTLTLVGFLYNMGGKGWGVVGHALVAWGVAIIPFYGGAVVNPTDGGWLLTPLFIAIFICEIGREIIVCSGDYHGDVEQGWKTAPVRWGRKRAMQSVPLWFAGFIPFYALPYFGVWRWGAFFSPVYFWGYTIFIAGLYLCWAAIYWTMTHTEDEKRIWRSFELYARTGTRLFIIFTEVVLILEAFWGGH